MYIESVPNRNSPPAILLRESYREDGKVRHETLANLSALLELTEKVELLVRSDSTGAKLMLRVKTAKSLKK